MVGPWGDWLAPVLGPDLSGLLQPTPTPTFLSGFDWDIAPGQVASLVKALDLTRGVLPEPQEFHALPDEKTIDYERLQNEPWTSSLGLPALPSTSLKIPRLVVEIWLGSPLVETGGGAMSTFMKNLATAAARYHADSLTDPGEGVTFAVLTDIPRDDFRDAQDPVKRAKESYLDDVYAMAQWARGVGGYFDDSGEYRAYNESGDYQVSLLNVGEWFSEGFLNHLVSKISDDWLIALVRAAVSVHNHEASRVDLAGKASTSDILRILWLLVNGGGYNDGDNKIGQDLLVGLRDIVEMPSALGISAKGTNTVFFGPAGHPFFRATLEDQLYRFTLNRYELNFHEGRDDEAMMPDRGGKNEKWAEPQFQTRRRSTAFRTGLSHETALIAGTLLKPTIHRDTFIPDMSRVSLVSFIKDGSTRSWVGQMDAPTSASRDTPAARMLQLQRIASHLKRSLLNLKGPLDLQVVKNAVDSQQSLADHVWEAVLTYISQHPDLGPLLAWVIDGELVEHDPHPRTVDLPPGAKELIVVDGSGKDDRWPFGQRMRPAQWRGSMRGQVVDDLLTGRRAIWVQHRDQSYQWVNAWENKPASQLPVGLTLGTVEGTGNVALLDALSQLLKRVQPETFASETNAAVSAQLLTQSHWAWTDTLIDGKPIKLNVASQNDPTTPPTRRPRPAASWIGTGSVSELITSDGVTYGEGKPWGAAGPLMYLLQTPDRWIPLWPATHFGQPGAGTHLPESVWLEPLTRWRRTELPQATWFHWDRPMGDALVKAHPTNPDEYNLFVASPGGDFPDLARAHVTAALDELTLREREITLAAQGSGPVSAPRPLRITVFAERDVVGQAIEELAGVYPNSHVTYVTGLVDPLTYVATPPASLAPGTDGTQPIGVPPGVDRHTSS